MRVVEIDGQPWFVAADVCRCLGLDTYSGTHRFLKPLSADEQQVVRYGEGTSKQIAGALFAGAVGPGAKGGATSLTLITESGLYKLIMRSDKPEAEPLPPHRRWRGKRCAGLIDQSYEAGREAIPPKPFGGNAMTPAPRSQNAGDAGLDRRPLAHPKVHQPCL